MDVAAQRHAGNQPEPFRDIAQLEWVERHARETDFVIVDSPPHAATEARIAVRAANLVLIPVQPSPMDLWATKATLDLARSERVPAGGRRTQLWLCALVYSSRRVFRSAFSLSSVARSMAFFCSATA